MDFINRDKDRTVAQDFCDWVVPLFASDATNMQIGVPVYGIPQRQNLFAGDTYPSPTMASLARYQRRFSASQQIPPVDKIYTFHSYRNALGQTVEHDEAFKATDNSFYSIRLSEVPHEAELARAARSFAVKTR